MVRRIRAERGSQILAREHGHAPAEPAASLLGEVPLCNGNSRSNRETRFSVSVFGHSARRVCCENFRLTLVRPIACDIVARPAPIRLWLDVPCNLYELGRMVVNEPRPEASSAGRCWQWARRFKRWNSVWLVLVVWERE